MISISPYAENSGILSYVSLAGSIGLTISIIYATSLGCKKRAEDFRQNYNALQELLNRLEATEDNQAANSFQQINIEYSKLLSTVENHKNIDYLNVVRAGYDENSRMSFSKWCYVLGYYVGDWAWKIIVIVLPIVYIASILI